MQQAYKLATTMYFMCCRVAEECTSYMYVIFNEQKGRNALHCAAEQGSKECLKLLVHEYRADPEEVDMVCG